MTPPGAGPGRWTLSGIIAAAAAILIESRRDGGIMPGQKRHHDYRSLSIPAGPIGRDSAGKQNSQHMHF